uniref:Uncharacterized protein n=1 Tax=Panagrolaimus superbus TaxID=310955 RepID=A0A914XXT2_9BILA
MHFHLDNTQKGTINEYHHVFEQIQRKEKNFKRAKKCQVQQAGRLLINYVSFLINKCYTETLDRPDYCQERLESEVDFLATTLKSVGDAALGDDITETWKNYKNFCELDNAAIIGQDKLLEQALELAHKRATENVYQSAIRQIHERIKELEEVCQKRISEIVSVSKVLKTAVINPGNTLKNLKGFIKDPKGSIKALRKYAKKHPWRFAAICIGSLTIGLVCGGAVAATVAIVDIFVPFSIPVIALAAVAIGTGAVSSTALVNVGVTAEAVVKIENEVNEEIGIEIAKEAEILNQNIEDGKQIASDIKFDQERRKEINKLEKKIFEQKKVEQETREKINKMALVELEGTKEQLDVAVKQLTAELEEFKKDSEKSENMVNEIQEKMSKIDEGKAAASWFVQDAQEKNSSSRMDESSG